MSLGACLKVSGVRVQLRLCMCDREPRRSDLVDALNFLSWSWVYTNYTKNPLNVSWSELKCFSV